MQPRNFAISRYRFRRLVQTQLTVSALFLGSALGASGYNAIVAFGDSYTDTHNLPSSPPQYWQGRFSNGPLWIEYLSRSLGFSYNPVNNYAVSGSESDELGTQIAKFPGTSDSANVLFVLWSGSNDFGTHLNLGYDDAAWSKEVNAIISSLMTASGLLYQKGARNLVLFNQIDLTRLPYIRNAVAPTFRAYLLGKINHFNSQLLASVPGLVNAYPGLKVYYIDLYSNLNFLFDNFSSYGFTQATQDALDDTSLTDKSFTGPGSTYVLWDSQHPTTKTHSLIAGWVGSEVAGSIQDPTVSISAPQNGAQVAWPATIPISASVSPNGWNINSVSFFQDGVLLGAVTNGPYNYDWTGVAVGSYSLSAQANYGAGQTVGSGSIQVTVTPPAVSSVPSPWEDQDIGPVGNSGSAGYAADGTFTITSAGADIWGTTDAFHYVYQTFSGNGTIVACVTSIQNTDGFAKAGLMFRATLDPGSANVFEFITPSQGLGFQYRGTNGSSSTYVQGSAVVPPSWLKLERQGGLWNGYASSNGSDWTLTSSILLPMSDLIYIGMAVSSHNNAVLNTATFNSVVLQAVPAPTLPVMAIVSLADGTPQISMTGTVGAYYRCDASSDFYTWIPIATNLNQTGIIQFTDTQAVTLGQRYYRGAVEQ